jgi:hypothetical protein
MRCNLVSSIAAALVLAVGAGDAGAVPASFSLTGRLAKDGAPVDGAITLGLELYDVAQDGSPLWSESHATVADRGVIAVAMGGDVPLDPGDFGGGDLWLGVTVDGTALSPRLAIRSVPYALRAGVCDSADSLGGLGPEDFAAAGHDHAGTYLPVGATLACGGTDKVTGVDAATGDVSCAADQDTTYSAAAGGGLSVASNAFSVASGGVTRAMIAGTEVALYSLPAGCGVVGTPTFQSTCVTVSCGGPYRDCSGVCVLPGPLSCSTTLVGYLVAP